MPFPTTGVLSTFTGADGTTPPTGFSREPLNDGTTGGFKIASNTALVVASVEAYEMVWWPADTFGPDLEAWVDLAVAPGDAYFYLPFRITTPSDSASTADGYLLELINSGTLTFYRVDNGVSTPIGSSQSVTGVSTGDALGVEAVGDTFQAYKRVSGVWSTLGATRTDSTYTGAGYIGFGVYDPSGSSAAFDNFGGGTRVTAQIVAVAQATESDSAQGVARSKRKALGQSTETETAQAVTRRKAKTLGQNAETDAAQALTSRKARTLGQATEGDTAQAVTVNPRRRLVSPAAEADAAQALARVKARVIGQAIETDTAGAVTSRKRVTLGQAQETDLAQPIAAAGELIVAVGQASETDVAQPVGRVKVKAIGQVVESDTAQALTRVKAATLGQVSEADLAQPIVHLKVKAIGQATEGDTAQPVLRLKALTIGQALEADAAQGLTSLKRMGVAQAEETDSAGAVVLGGQVLGGGSLMHRDAVLTAHAIRVPLAAGAHRADLAAPVIRADLEG